MKVAVFMQLQDPNPALLIILVLIVDALIGDPKWFYRWVPHPVILFGWVIGRLEIRLNRPNMTYQQRQFYGIGSLFIVLILAIGSGLAFEISLMLLPARWAPAGYGVEILFASTLLAQKTLFYHVRIVAKALETKGLIAGQQAVAHIVGRDANQLDMEGVVRAAIESAAENFSDGIVAPIFWYAVAGLPGLLLYKAVNTADSMIGYKTTRYKAFGWAAARFDDVLNWIPARLAGGLILLAGALAPIETAYPGPASASRNGWGRFCVGWKTLWLDAARHTSPNAGWQEAPMAGILGIALCGPRQYGDGIVDHGWLNQGGRFIVQPTDIHRAILVLLFADAVLWDSIILVVIFFWMV